MAGSSSRDKGARAERQAIELLQPVVTELYQARGLDAPKLQRNTLQSDGGGFDIVGLRWMALVVKHQEVLKVEDWWQQTLRQAKNNAEPILFYKQNNVKFRIRMWATLHVFRTERYLCHPVEIGVPDFLQYFRLRLEAELAREFD